MNSILTKDYLYKNYIEEKLSCNEIAQKLGCSWGLVYRKLKKYNIITRGIAEASSISIKNLDINLVKFLYQDEKLKIADISKKLNCSVGFLYKYLKDNHIVRDRYNYKISKKYLIG